MLRKLKIATKSLRHSDFSPALSGKTPERKNEEIFPSLYHSCWHLDCPPLLTQSPVCVPYQTWKNPSSFFPVRSFSSSFPENVIQREYSCLSPACLLINLFESQFR